LSPRDGFQLRTGDLLQTPSNGTAVVQYLGEPTRLDLAAGTRLRFQKSRHGKSLGLEAGEISVAAGHQATNAPMMLVTPQAEARVVGTRFTLSARRFSTWLEVSEGGVALKRGPGGRKEPGSTSSELDSKPILVKSGEYAVVADGIPLEAHRVTERLNSANPLPLKIDWFSYYAQPSWYVHPPRIQQTQATNTARTFHLPAVAGSILLAGEISVDTAGTGPASEDGKFGFGIGLSSQSDYLLACVRQAAGQPVLAIVDVNLVPLAEVPVPAVIWSHCKVKYALERDFSGEAVVRAKVWSGADEPEAWQLSTTVKLRRASNTFELRLITLNSACTFDNVSAFFTE
jgi:hypothetical protein